MPFFRPSPACSSLHRAYLLHRQLAADEVHCSSRLVAAPPPAPLVNALTSITSAATSHEMTHDAFQSLFLKHLKLSWSEWRSKELPSAPPKLLAALRLVPQIAFVKKIDGKEMILLLQHKEFKKVLQARERVARSQVACTSAPHHSSILCLYDHSGQDAIDERGVLEFFTLVVGVSYPERLEYHSVDERKSYLRLTYQLAAEVAVFKREYCEGRTPKSVNISGGKVWMKTYDEVNKSDIPWYCNISPEWTR